MIPNKQNTSNGIMGKKLNKNLPNALPLDRAFGHMLYPNQART